MPTTHNPLPKKSRAAIVELFSARLLDALDLKAHAKQAHWNVKGPSFIALHELFDSVAAEADTSADLLAERIVQLGGHAIGTAPQVAKHSTLKAYPLDIDAQEDHVKALTLSLAGFSEAIRHAIDESSTLGDQAAADICTQILRAIDKLLWMVESHATG